MYSKMWKKSHSPGVENKIKNVKANLSIRRYADVPRCLFEPARMKQYYLWYSEGAGEKLKELKRKKKSDKEGISACYYHPLIYWINE